MSSKEIALTILEVIFIVLTVVLLLAVVGLPLDRLFDHVDMWRCLSECSGGQSRWSDGSLACAGPADEPDSATGRNA